VGSVVARVRADVGTAARSLGVGLAVTLLTLAVGAAYAPSAAPPTSARLQKATAAFSQEHRTYPGVLLAVISPRLHSTRSAGHDALGSSTMLDPRAGFRIASVTKTFTAAAILRLVESGRVGLDDPISKHLSPATLDVLRQGGYDADTILVRHLLTHTSGLYDYASDPAFVQFVLTHGRHHWTRSEQVRFAMTHGKPYAAPGAEFHYSDTGYVLLGEILERTTGGGLARAYRNLLSFKRLGLADTYLESLEPRPRGAHARTHQYYETIDSTAFDPSFDLYGGGGLVSTVDDLARFYRALFHGRLFKKATTLPMMLGKPNPQSLDDLGMGIFSNQFGGRSCWGHSGFWGTTVVHCPRSDVTLALAVNQGKNFDRPSQRFLTKVLELV
jgi:D-alanyl-D-alanine carboxypeptidase